MRDLHKHVLTTFLFLTIFFSPCIGQDKTPDFKISEDLVANKVTDSILLITHYFPWSANSLLVILPNNNAVLIDTPNKNSNKPTAF